MRAITGLWVMLGPMLAALLLAGCGEVLAEDKAPDYRYRLTVEVDTPKGLRTGSSVIEVEQSLGGAGTAGGLAGKQIYFRTRGEAVAVDLPDGKVLFALLRSENDIDWANRVMLLISSGGNNAPFDQAFKRIVKLKGEKVVPRMWRAVGHLPRRSAYPMLVTFGDLSDPTSVALVEPDNLSASFGEGVSLKRITVQLTDDPVTTGIEQRLGWLGVPFERKLTADDFPDGFPVGDLDGLFTKGL